MIHLTFLRRNHAPLDRTDAGVAGSTYYASYPRGDCCPEDPPLPTVFECQGNLVSSECCVESCDRDPYWAIEVCDDACTQSGILPGCCGGIPSSDICHDDAARAALTGYTEECCDSGCKYRGQFYCESSTWSETEVQGNDIVAFFTTADPNADSFYGNYCGETIQITKGGVSFHATIRDTCSDEDCDGCCSENASNEGYLVDIEIQTVLRHFGSTEAYDNMGDELSFVITS